MSPRPEISAYFVHEADARRTADALDAMFENYLILKREPINGRRWLLTIVLPDDPALGTFYVDAILLAMVHELVEGNLGALWAGTVSASEATEPDPNNEPGPQVAGAMHRRVAGSSERHHIEHLVINHDEKAITVSLAEMYHLLGQPEGGST